LLQYVTVCQYDNTMLCLVNNIVSNNIVNNTNNNSVDNTM
jgi:hypothetical protein